MYAASFVCGVPDLNSYSPPELPMPIGYRVDERIIWFVSVALSVILVIDSVTFDVLYCTVPKKMMNDNLEAR
jgi:hypothetical protein